MNNFSRPYICSKCALRSAMIWKASFPPKHTLSSRKYSVQSKSRDGRSFRLAVIGSGPAGFYTAYKVMANFKDAKIDMYEQLPVPFGLVRFGVAPDHPEVKNCEDKFREVAESPKFNFIGNVAIGTEPKSLPLTMLVPHYDAILFAYGASKDRKLGIPGEDKLKGIYSARAFVGWYNGLPEYADLAPDLCREDAIIIGQGNVALDVARILLSDIDILRRTDITTAAFQTLAHSRVKNVRVVGRRGPMQAAFTIKEVRELMKLPGVAYNCLDDFLIPPNVSKLPRAQKRMMELLKKGSDTLNSSASKSWFLDYRLSPTSFNAEPKSSETLSSISFEKMSLSPDAFDPNAKAEGTFEHIDLKGDIAFRSIGYKAEPLPEFPVLGISFDDRLGIIRNDGYGRVLNVAQEPAQTPMARHLPGFYCAGWVKRGPTGVIASTMNDAFATAEAIAHDWNAHALFIGSEGDYDTSHDGWLGLRDEAEKRGCRRVSWEDWRKIDEAEHVRGKARGKEREKFTRIEDMLAVIE